MRAKCADPCKWYIYASHVPALGTEDFVVKTIYDIHTNCSHAWRNKNMTSNWVADKFEESVRSNMNMPVRQLLQSIDEQYSCEITRNKGYKALAMAKAAIKGSASQQYIDVGRYAAELQKTHPDTTIDIKYSPRADPESNPRFMRFYCCLGPMKKGFREGCRPLIALDGCHTKGAYPGQLLIAIGADPNNGWWPLAWAVVEKEAREQWLWFLSLLIGDLEIPATSSEYTFISDQQKGLDSALLELLPEAGHRYCVQHMYRNFKKKHPGEVLKEKFWSIAAASTVEFYEAALEELRAYDQQAHAWVKRAAPPHHWCKAFFPLHVKSDMLVNNLSETFNSHILNAREMPVIGMVEWIREFVMERISNRVCWMRKCSGPVGPAIRALIEEREKFSRKWKPISNGKGGYQVRGPKGEQFAVYLRDRTCTCRLWQISGLPCCHAISAILKIGRNPNDYADQCYSRDLFFQIYENVLYPISGKSLWPQSDIPILDPPLACVQPGRPKKARRKGSSENRSGVHVGTNNVQKLKKHVIMHCRRCGQAGHNAATCKSVPENNGGEGCSQPAPAPKHARKSKGTNNGSSTTHGANSQEPDFAHVEVQGYSSSCVNSQPHGAEEQTTSHNDTGSHAERNAQAASSSTKKQQIRKTKTPVRRVRPVNDTDQSTTAANKQSLHSKRKLSEIDKIRINTNYEYLGKEPPFKIGRWAGTSRSSRSRSGRSD
ncbi:uncharacterized protein [Coffea arabica]|uniref:SWIM-type domain-containing protein n=1 Tax=Coffea arabica TaxID=13443 RepID=A0ABM4W8B6_COFAR